MSGLSAPGPWGPGCWGPLAGKRAKKWSAHQDPSLLAPRAMQTRSTRSSTLAQRTSFRSAAIALGRKRKRKAGKKETPETMVERVAVGPDAPPVGLLNFLSDPRLGRPFDDRKEDAVVCYLLSVTQMLFALVGSPPRCAALASPSSFPVALDSV